MSILDTFFILFDADTSKLGKGIDDADKKSESFLDKLKKIDGAADSTSGKFRALLGHAAALGGLGLSFGAIIHGIQSTAKEYTELSKLALQFRATVDAVDDFRDAAGLLGMTEEASTESLHAMERAIQDTVLGMGRSQKVFEELGIHVKGADGKIKATTTVITELSEKLKKLDRGTQIRVMERLGLDPSLLKLFNSDLLALQKRMEDVDRAAGFNLEDAVKRSNEYTKASKELGIEVRTLQMYMEKLAEKFKIQALPWLTKAVEVATDVTRKFVAYLMGHSHFVEGVFIAIGAAIAYFLVPAAISGALAVWAMIAPFALVGAAVVGVAALFALLYDDIVNFTEGNDSLIGNVVKKWPWVKDAVLAVWEVIKFLAETISDLANIVIQANLIMLKAFLDLGAGIVSDWGEKLAWLREAFQSVGDFVGGIMKWLIDLVSNFLDKFGGVVGVAKAIAGAVRGGLGEAKSFLGIKSDAGVAGAVTMGRQQLQLMSSSPVASTTSNAISNSTRAGGNKSVSIGKVDVHTQATDADGIARGIGESLGSHMRQAAGQFDDGVDA